MAQYLCLNKFHSPGREMQKFLKTFTHNISISVPKKLVEHILSESSIHGTFHIVSKGRHYIERIFWCLSISISIYFTTSICLSQWIRYQNNATILTIETDYRTWTYDHISGLTVCTDYINDKIANDMIKEFWNVSNLDPKYDYYMDFILTVAFANIGNLRSFEKFTNDSTLEKIDMLDVARDIKIPEDNLIVIPIRQVRPKERYTINEVITEFGICSSTTHLYRYQNPNDYGDIKGFNTIINQICRSIEKCKFAYTPHVHQENVVKLYIHGLHDILTSDMSHLGHNLGNKTRVDFEFKRLNYEADEEIRSLPRSRRTCLFHSETISKYFDVYTRNLCKMECRVEAAIEKCGCLPFFYNLRNAGKPCTPRGLVCLAHSDWQKIPNCDCPELCERDIFSIMKKSVQSNAEFTRMATITLISPKIRIVEKLWFDLNELIVSFGGAAGLLLGSSFLSIMEIPFLTVEYIAKRYMKKKI